MMMLKKLRCLALVLALVLVFVSCTTFAAVKPVKLIYGTYFPIDHFYVKTDRFFKQLVEKNSKGQISIDYFPVSQLGSGPEMLQAIKSGAQQLFCGGLPADYYPALYTFELPYIYRDETHLKKVGKRLTSIIDTDKFVAKTGSRILGVRLTSPRHLVTKFPVMKLADIKGLKIRVPGNPLSLATWKAFGAIPTTIPGSDTYTALATGTIDAAENPFADIYAWKYQELLKYCALTGHVRSIYAMIINNNCWNSLTAAQRKILKNAAAKSDKYCERLRKKDEKKYKGLLAKEGMKFTAPDTLPFRKKAKTAWGQVGDEELIKKIEAIK
jgi:tripartite ATP-independent transporter DctP family solute receptor